MKKIIAISLLLVTVLMLLAGCKQKVDTSDIDTIKAAYGRSYPHRIEVTSTQQFGSQSLNSSTTLVRGTVGSDYAAKKITNLERLRSIEDGSGIDVYGPVETIKEELWYIASLGISSDKGETWDAEGENFFPEKGTFALNLNPDLMSDIVYEDGTMSFKVLKANSKAFFGADTSITDDASVTIVTAGGTVNEVKISWVKPENIASGVEMTTVTLRAVYIYDQQKVTFD